MADLDTLRLGKKIWTGSFTGITSDQLLAIFTDKGQANSGLVDISDVDWERIVIDLDVTTLTGTSVTFKLKTANTRGGTAIAATTQDAKNGAGTAIDSGSLTAAGRVMFAVARYDADNAASNIGALIGLYADVTSITALVGNVSIYVGK